MVSPTLASRVHVFFGTVTGNAEEIARRIAAELTARGVDAGTAVSLADFASAPAFTTGAPAATVVFVASTTGDGDPPDTIRPFMRFLRKCAKDRTALAHVRYAMLGLGDTNYEQFCNTAKKIDAGLLAAGAKPFVPRGLADDGTGLEAVVEPWITALYESLDLLADSGSVQSVSDAAAKKDATAEKLTITSTTATTFNTASAISSSPFRGRIHGRGRPRDCPRVKAYRERCRNFDICRGRVLRGQRFGGSSTSKRTVTRGQ
jgi:sulfite reductase alpha subunit-like flavoprotein